MRPGHRRGVRERRDDHLLVCQLLQAPERRRRAQMLDQLAIEKRCTHPEAAAVDRGGCERTTALSIFHVPYVADVDENILVNVQECSAQRLVEIRREAAVEIRIEHTLQRRL